MDNATLVPLIIVGLLCYAFIHATLAVLGHRLSTQVRRHKIIYDARQRRQDYFRALAQRAAAVSGMSTDENDPGPYNVDIVPDDELDTPAAKAA